MFHEQFYNKYTHFFLAHQVAFFSEALGGEFSWDPHVLAAAHWGGEVEISSIRAHVLLPWGSYDGVPHAL